MLRSTWMKVLLRGLRGRARISRKTPENCGMVCVRRFAAHLPGGVLQRGHDGGGHRCALEIGEGGDRARADRRCLVFQRASQCGHRLFVLERT